MKNKLYQLNRLWHAYLKDSELMDEFTVDTLSKLLVGLEFIVLTSDGERYSETEKFKPYRTRYHFHKYIKNLLAK